MKIIYTVLFLIISTMACTTSHRQNTVEISEDTLSVIEFMCREAEKDNLTPKEIAHWDSANANGGYMLVRGAERELDTIVNHLHMIFITEP